MKFKVNTRDLVNALDVVGIVPPQQVNQQGGTGYLLVVRGERCYVYSRDKEHVARAEFPIFEVEGEGAFIYPADYVSSFRLAGETCAFETKEEGDQYIVKYVGSSGATSERPSFNPKFMNPFDRDLEAAKDSSVFSAAMLREAISICRPFLGKAQDTKVEDHNKLLQIFDKTNPLWAKGDGYMYATTGVQIGFFYCEAFVGKSLEIHGAHLPLLTAFLSKCDGDVTIKKGENHTFVIDQESRVFGWVHHKGSHGKFSYYTLKFDTYVLAIDKGSLIDALRYTRGELKKDHDKIKVIYDHTDTTIRFSITDGSKTDSFRVPVRVVEPVEGEERKSLATTQGFSFNVNIDHFMEMADTAGKQVELRVYPFTPPGRNKETALFRTVDDFRMNLNGKVVVEPEGSFRCRATRFMPAKD